MKRSGQRVLFILFGAIGDVTRALPLLCRIRKGLPEAHLAWAVEPLSRPLVNEHPALDEVILFDRARGAPAFVSFLRSVRRARFDLALDLGRHLKSGVTSLATGAPRRVGFNRVNSREGNWRFQTETIPPQEHYSSKLEQYLQFADQLGVPGDGIEFGLVTAEPVQKRVRRLLANVPRPFAVYVLGSSCSSRRWFPDRTAQAAARLLQERELAPVLVGTAADQAFAASVQSYLARLEVPFADLVGKTSLQDLVAVLREAHLVVTPDSGSMHLAAAVGTPVVSLWGATSAGRSAPYGSEQATLTGDAACAPCYLKECPIGRVCMEAIGTSDVLRAAEARLAEPLSKEEARP